MSRRMPLPIGWTLAVLAMSLFGSLGAWQWGRAEQKEAMLADTARVLAERQPLALALAADASRRQAYDWVAGEGEFLPGPAILLDNQTRDRQPGVRAYRVFLPVEHLGLRLGERFTVDEADSIAERLVYAFDGGICVGVRAEQTASAFDEGV